MGETYWIFIQLAFYVLEVYILSVVVKAFKFRIYPNIQQAKLIDKTISHCRFVYNYYLDKRIKAYQENKMTLSKNDCIKDLTKLKKLEEFNWLSEVDSSALQQKLIDLDNAYVKFFKEKKVGFPKFKSKKHSKLSYRTTNTGNIKVIDNKYITVRKLGQIKCKFDRELNGQIINVTISKTKSNKYFISICCKNSIVKEFNKTNKKVGIDLGLKDLIILSDGMKFENQKFLKQSEKKLIRLQRRLSRKQVNSNNFEKQRIKIAKLEEQIINQRYDYLQKVTTQLVKDYDLICTEDLNTCGLLKNHKLAKSISDVSWSKLLNVLEYKCIWYGKTLVKINRFYPSSKTCNICGYVKRDLKLSDRAWTCPQCNTHLDRDINAAVNILKQGEKLLSN